MAKSMIQNANAAQMQQARPKKEPQNIKEYIVAMKSGIAAALPSVMTPERFTRIALSAVSNNPKLQACTPDSFLGAMMQAAQLGLEPNTPLGQAYLIPYGGKCQFQVGYKGLLELAWRSGEIRDIQAEVVYQNDVWEYELGLEPKLRHIPADTDRGDPVRYYAVIRTKDGGYISAVMSVEDVQAHARKYSQSYNNGPWKTSFDEMAKKTVMKRALKYAPLRMPKFLTIRQAAARPDCPVSEGTLRRMVKNGEVPGFYSGSWFYLNFSQFLELIDHKCRETVKQKEEKSDG